MWDLGMRRALGEPPAGGEQLQPHPEPPCALFTHPQQGLLGLWLMLIASRLNALAHCFWEQFLVLDLPQVLICLLALLLQRSTASK